MKFNESIIINGKVISKDSPCYVIAEAGLSHFGSYEKALKLIDMAVNAQADAIKFQILDIESLISAKGVEWKNRFKNRVLPLDDFVNLQSYAKSNGITFFATAHDRPSLDFLNKIDVPAFKIGSGELQNFGFIQEIASKRKPVIISTGMYSEKDIHDTLEAIYKVGNRDIIILHCVTRYPTPASEVNLNFIRALQAQYDVLVGYSDHTAGYHIPLAAVACGAKVIEKHISIDFDVPNAQDWKVSCGDHNLADFVRELREVESALGFDRKEVSDSELESIKWARKSLTTTCEIQENTILTEEMVSEKRPGEGIPPSNRSKVIGRRVVKNLGRDYQIKFEDLK